MKGYLDIISVFQTGFRAVPKFFRAESIYSTIICLYSNGIGSTAGNDACNCKRNMFVINGVRIFSCNCQDLDSLQGIRLQDTLVGDVYMGAGSNTAP